MFDFEWLAADPLFCHLAGGAVPSIDTAYDDLRRFGATELDKLRGVITKQGLLPVQVAGMRDITIDIDTSVTPLFGEQEGAVVGYNRRFHGRPSYPPILARIAETDTVLGARLRPGNTTLGKDDAKDIEQWLGQLHRAAPKAVVTVRIDAGGDCAALLAAVERGGAHFVVKMKQTSNLVSAVAEGMPPERVNAFETAWS